MSILRLLSAVPPDRHAAEKILLKGQPNKTELAGISAELTEECICECYNPWKPNKQYKCRKDMHSYYILDTLKLLLEYGLDPNVIADDENVMWNVQEIDPPDLGATALRLLLEHGGNPNLMPDRSLNCFEDTDAYLHYSDIDCDSLSLIQSLFLLAAYGGRWRNGALPITMLNGYDVDIFKDFELYEYRVERYSGSNNCGNWMIHVYKKDTGEEVARYS